MKNRPRSFPPLFGLIVLIITLALFASAAPAAEPTDPTKHYLGINFWYLTDWDGSNAFVDIIKHARDWQNYDWLAKATIDSNGWPTQDCSTVFFGLDCEMGTYKLVFTGQAAAINMLWTGGSVTNKVYSAGTNTTTADVTVTNTQGGGLQFQGTKRLATDSPGTGITNVRLYRPGYPSDGSVVFTTRFLNVTNKFQVLRFVWWTNGWYSPIETWSQRLNPNRANIGEMTINGHTGGREMVAMEHCVQLCNQVNADMWLNIPVNADDDFITKTAQLLRYGSDGVNPYTSVQGSPVYPPLNSNLKVYVELGNEIWLWVGACQGWQHEKTEAIRGAPFTHPIEYDGYTDEWGLVNRYTAWRMSEISKMFRVVFGDAAMMTRIRPSYMGQFGGGWRDLSFVENFYGTYRPGTDPFPNTDPHPVKYYFYGAGAAPYYGVIDWSSPNPDTFFAPSNWPQPGWGTSVGQDAMLAANWGLKNISYEGGFSFGGDGGANTFTDPEKRTLNADARLKNVVLAYHDVWTQNGGDLLTYFCAMDPTPNWGCTWDIDINNTPKLQASDDIRDTRSRVNVTLGQQVPGTLVLRNQATYLNGGAGSFFDATIGGEDCRAGRLTGTGVVWFAYPVNTTQEGNYNVSVRLCSDYAGSFNLNVLINGDVVGAIPVTGDGGARVLYNTSTLQVPVYKGLSAIRLAPQSPGDTSNLFLRSVNFTFVSSFNLTINTTSLPNGTVGTPYNQTLAASGGPVPYTWSLVSGSLPAGLALNSTSGVISGTPTAAGTSNFTAQVRDNLSVTDTQALSIIINAVSSLNITTTSLPNGLLGNPYSQTIAATGGWLPYTWSLASGSLPGGLGLNSTSGVISGTPTASGTFNFTAQVTDSATPTHATDTQALSLYISPLGITTTSLPAGNVGNAYSQTLAASGGTLPYIWSIFSGSLPAGLGLNSTSGVISGTPTATGTSNFTARVTDSYAPANTDDQALSIVINQSCTFINFLATNEPRPDPAQNRAFVMGGGNMYKTIAFSTADGGEIFNAVNSQTRWFGGVKFDASPNVLDSGFIQLRTNDPIEDPSHPNMFWAYVDEGVGAPSKTTINFMWRKSQYLNGFSSQTVAFDNSASSSFVINVQDLAPDAKEVRFVIKNGTTYYLSEYFISAVGTYTFDTFNNSGTAGKRWGVFAPTASDFGIPTTLPTFNAMNFDNVTEVGFVYKGEKSQYGNNFEMVQFTVSGIAIQPVAPILTVTASGANLQLSFPTAAGKSYRLFKNTTTPKSGDAGWVYDNQSVNGDGTIKSFTVPKPAAGKIFYTVEFTL